MRRAWLVGLMGVLGCDPETVDCTTEAVPSVRVEVTDADGAPLTGATVTYSSAESSGLCDALDGDYTCGYEIGGVVTVRAELEGYVTAEDSVTVLEDECHVRTVDVTLVLVQQAP
jgi:hypothetical protein